ncbi:hypothetical protein [Actinoplanes sp. N902-109]|uniref:hypothetical protein n=1 Tax=Actinoplanes sp. (strain N902-109) TaxID=649831 RepID=UPI0003294B0F|nr:hypothetical protein [Actinoplanes sp. N902-109]AGL15455.1 hypothetical protein L083_1945 [Actinoplanes sp. N902-109]
MLALQAVLETPVRDQWLVADGGCDPGVFAALAVADPDAPGELHVPGRLRLTDTTTGIVVMLECWLGLKDWRDWAELLSGTASEPVDRIDDLGGHLLVWAGKRAGPCVRVPRAAVPGLLRGVRADLLALVAVLAHSHGAAFAARADRALAAGAPLH